jgi:hypothetical protein
MPVEVRELVIKATVAQDGASTGTASSGGSSNSSPAEEIINSCVQKVLEILKDQNGR